jgi:glycosyltransferase involved in cell wall biosynthesis
MRVAFLANRYLDPRSPASWSGLPYFAKRALENAGVETQVVWCNDRHRSTSWARFFYWHLVHRKRYLWRSNLGLLKGYARQIETQLAYGPPVDAVFSVSTWLLAFLRTSLPTVFYTDACFGALLGFYESFSNLAPPSISEGHIVEQQALDRCSRAIYSSHWAARKAREFYNVDPAKLSVICFGAGFHHLPDPADIENLIRKRNLSQCNLLLVGVDWIRKGADIAVDAVKALQKRGFNARLTIVGCTPPRDRRLPSFVELIPFLDKRSSEGQNLLQQLFRRSHFFIFPTRADALGIVLSEAGAYGIPALATDVGGVSSIILNEVNGRLFDFSAPGEVYAEYIASVITNAERYRQMSVRSLHESVTRLSWDVAGSKIAEILDQVSCKNAHRKPFADVSTES